MAKTRRLSDAEVKSLALSLLRADRETEVIEVLRKHGYWDDDSVWRDFGDTDNNYSPIGNQQSKPEAALVEKLVNAVDARLMNECLICGLDPESKDAPISIRDAVSRFFENVPDQLKEARNITLAVTGARPRDGYPSLTIVDRGEGQTPDRLPETFLSLDRKNKQRIPFVQGKFNMGGTGALKFCGQEKLQLLITRRNPAVLKKWKSKDSRASEWAVTVVRRDRPKPGVGNVRNSVYRYLAPIDANLKPNKGEVLSFQAEALPLFPDKNAPYVRDTSWGSAVKLYEYELKGRGMALRTDGLLSRLELLLPGVALPIRLHECRVGFQGHAGSFENSIVGLSARLEQNRGQNLEKEYPASVPFMVRGERMVAQIYAFKSGKAEAYTSNEGVIFVVNGQTHGSLPKTFFERKAVRMQRLAKSLLIVVDCSELSVGAREDLFMNSRDRLSNGELRRAVEDQLEDLVSHHRGLRELQELRRNQEVEEELSESKPLEEIIDRILKSSPSLAKLFLLGQRLGKPFRGKENGLGGGGGKENGAATFEGRPHPSYFRFSKKRDGETLTRTAEIGRKCRIKFETDVENGYFSRPETPGHYYLDVLDGSLEGGQLDSNVVLFNGIANWSISIPDIAVVPGDELTVQCTVTDDTLLNPYVNVARIRLTVPSLRKGGKKGEKEEQESGGDEEGPGPGAGSGGSGQVPGRQTPLGIKLPKPRRVRKGDQLWKERGFDDFSACTFVEDSIEGDNDRSELTFYVNVDNRYLKTDLKEGEDAVGLYEAKFVYGNVLLALALIHSARGEEVNRASDGNGEDESVVKRVEWVTRAVAPFLVPMIDSLGGLSEEQVSELAQQGDDE